MIVSQEFIQMAKAAEEIQNLRPNSLKDGDYFTINGEDLFLFTTERYPGLGNVVWLPRIDQLFQIVPNLIDATNGVRRVLESISYSYYIPNKGHSYKEIEEQILSYVMYRCYGKIWIPKEEDEKYDKDTKRKNKYHWYEEKKLNSERIEALIGFYDINDNWRTVPIVEDNKVIGIRTEKYRYDFDNSKIEVLEESVKMFDKK